MISDLWSLSAGPHQACGKGSAKHWSIVLGWSTGETAKRRTLAVLWCFRKCLMFLHGRVMGRSSKDHPRILENTWKHEKFLDQVSSRPSTSPLWRGTVEHRCQIMVRTSPSNECTCFKSSSNFVYRALCCVYACVSWLPVVLLWNDVNCYQCQHWPQPFLRHPQMRIPQALLARSLAQRVVQLLREGAALVVSALLMCWWLIYNDMYILYITSIHIYIYIYYIYTCIV